MDRVLLRLYTATFLFTMMMGMGLPLVPQHLTETFLAPLGLVGLLAGVYGAMQIVLRLPMGDMADRRGRKRSLSLTFILTAAAGAFMVPATNVWWFLPGMALFGLASGIFWVAANSYLFDRVSEAEVPRATSDYAVAIGAAFLLGPPLGGVVADTWGYPAGLSVFLWASVLGLGLVATLPETPRNEPRRGTHLDVYRRAWRIFKHPDIAISGLGTLVFSMVFGVFVSFYPVYLQGLAYSAFAIGLFLALRQGASLVVRFRLPAAIERFGPRAILLAGVAVAALGTALTPLASSDVPLAVLVVVVGAGGGVMIPANLTLVARGAPASEKGLANGIYGTALGLGGAVTNWVWGPVGESAGIAWTFWGSTLIALLGTAAVVVYAIRHAAAGGVRAVPEEQDLEPSPVGE